MLAHVKIGASSCPQQYSKITQARRGQNAGWNAHANECLLKMLSKPKRARKEQPAIMDAQTEAVVNDMDKKDALGKKDNPPKIDDNTAAGEPKDHANHKTDNGMNHEKDNPEKHATGTDDSDSDSSSSSTSSSTDEEDMKKMLKDSEYGMLATSMYIKFHQRDQAKTV